MFRVRNFLAVLLCVVTASCAFVSYEALIPPEAVVLPLGTAQLAETYVQNSEDPTRWDRSGTDGSYEQYAIRQEGYGYWLNEELWLVFAQMPDSSDEYLMQIATPNGEADGGYDYNYGVGKLIGDRLFMKLPDCDDLSMDTINALELDADCTLTSYDELKQVISETKGEVSYMTYHQLR
jgi:hypothetical protein